jgi:hypothetical protein
MEFFLGRDLSWAARRGKGGAPSLVEKSRSDLAGTRTSRSGEDRGRAVLKKADTALRCANAK